MVCPITQGDHNQQKTGPHSLTGSRVAVNFVMDMIMHNGYKHERSAVAEKLRGAPL